MPRRTASDPASRAAISASTAQALWCGVLGVVRERNLVQVIARVVHIEGGEAAVLALHPDEPVEGPTQRKREAPGIGGPVHRPGDGRGIVEVGVVAVGALESPAPAREVRTTRPPVARIVEQLPRLEPLESAESGGACAGGALLLHREACERGVPEG